MTDQTHVPAMMWIDVNDRKPKPRDLVVVTFAPEWTRRKDLALKRAYQAGDWVHASSMGRRTATHWMPIEAVTP